MMKNPAVADGWPFSRLDIPNHHVLKLRKKTRRASGRKPLIRESDCALFDSLENDAPRDRRTRRKQSPTGPATPFETPVMKCMSAPSLTRSQEHDPPPNCGQLETGLADYEKSDSGRTAAVRAQRSGQIPTRRFFTASSLIAAV